MHSTIQQFAGVYGPPCVFGDINELYLNFPFDWQEQEIIKDILRLLNCGIQKLTIHCYDDSSDQEDLDSPNFMSFLEDASSFLQTLKLLKIVYDWEPEDASLQFCIYYKILIKALCFFRVNLRPGVIPG